MTINFFVVYEEKSGKIIDDKNKIVINYLSGWFSVDFISSVPISYIVHLNGGADDGVGSSKVGLADLLKIPKLWRMIKLTKLFRLIKAIK